MPVIAVGAAIATSVIAGSAVAATVGGIAAISAVTALEVTAAVGPRSVPSALSPAIKGLQLLVVLSAQSVRLALSQRAPVYWEVMRHPTRLFSEQHLRLRPAMRQTPPMRHQMIRLDLLLGTRRPRRMHLLRA